MESIRPLAVHGEIDTEPQNLGFGRGTLTEMASFQGTDEEFIQRYWQDLPGVMTAAYNPSYNIPSDLIRAKVLSPVAHALESSLNKPPLYWHILDQIQRACEFLTDDRMSDEQRKSLFRLIVDTTTIRFEEAGQAIWENSVHPLMHNPKLSSVLVPELGHFITGKLKDTRPSYPAEILIREYMGSIGLDPSTYYEVKEAWARYQYEKRDSRGVYRYDKETAEESIRINLNAMVALQKRCPGTVKVLSGEYGFNAFARYHPDQMIRQVEETNDPGNTFMSSVAADDYNGAFSDLNWMNELSLQLKKAGIKHRVYELRSVEDMNRAYENECQKNQGYPSLVGSMHIAHGSTDRMTLMRDILEEHGFRSVSGGSDRTVFKQHNLLPQSLKNTRNRFYVPGPRPKVIYNSCSVGQGIALHISQEAGYDFFASKYPISGFSMTLPDPNTLEFWLKYTEHTETGYQELEKIM